MAEYLAGIDIGTTGSRCCIFDLTGELVGIGYREYPCYYPKSGWVEQDGNILIEQTFEACKEALDEFDGSPEEIKAVGFSTQRSVLGPVDENNNPLMNFIGWQDNRGADIIEDKFKKIISEEEYYEIDGMPLGSPTPILSKLIWLKENKPDVYEKTAVFTQNQDYFLREFGADDNYVDVCDAPFFGVFDVDKGEYSDKLLELFDLPKEKFPKITEPGTKVGEISKEISEATGFAEGTAIVVGAGDQNCAVLGAGVIEEGLASITLGTAGLCIAYSGEEIRDPNGAMMVTGNAGTGKWQIEGISLAAASSFRWYRDVFADIEKTMSNLTGEDTYNYISQQIANVDPGANGLLFLPYLTGAGTPRYNSKARGSLIGLDFSHTKPEIARSVMEGVTLEMKDIVEGQKAAGVEIEKYRVTGGATKSNLWNQIQANVYGKPIQLLQVSEVTALGAAILGGVGAGIFDDVYEGVDQMVTTTKEFKPEPENVSLYNKLYESYVKTYNALSKEDGVFEKLAKLR